MSDPFRQALATALAPTYALGEELGGGGMSHVFLAEEQALGRTVVVKVLPPDLAAGVNRDRFRREIQLAARLQHPHVVPLLAAGEVEGSLYYTMPFIDGESVRAALGRGRRFGVREVVRVLHDVVEALAHAHARGIIHRDVKPGNVLLQGSHALVTDFGVAKALSAARGDGAGPVDTFVTVVGGTTSTGLAIGTPAYMAPEQLAADPSADHRVDLYAAGLLAYEMLTGASPFVAESPRATLAAQLTRMPAPLDQVRPDVPPAVSAVVMSCLAKEPADRPPTAEAVLAALEAATQGGGTTPVDWRGVAGAVSPTAVTPVSSPIVTPADGTRPAGPPSAYGYAAATLTPPDATAPAPLAGTTPTSGATPADPRALPAYAATQSGHRPAVILPGGDGAPTAPPPTPAQLSATRQTWLAAGLVGGAALAMLAGVAAARSGLFGLGGAGQGERAAASAVADSAAARTPDAPGSARSGAVSVPRMIASAPTIGAAPMAAARAATALPPLDAPTSAEAFGPAAGSAGGASVAGRAAATASTAAAARSAEAGRPRLTREDSLAIAAAVERRLAQEERARRQAALPPTAPEQVAEARERVWVRFADSVRRATTALSPNEARELTRELARDLGNVVVRVDPGAAPLPPLPPGAVPPGSRVHVTGPRAGAAAEAAASPAVARITARLRPPAPGVRRVVVLDLTDGTGRPELLPLASGMAGTMRRTLGATPGYEVVDASITRELARLQLPIPVIAAATHAGAVVTGAFTLRRDTLAMAQLLVFDARRGYPRSVRAQRPYGGDPRALLGAMDAALAEALPKALDRVRWTEPGDEAHAERP